MEFLCGNCKETKSETPSVYLLALGGGYSRLCKKCASILRSRKERKNYKVSEYVIRKRVKFI